MAQLQLGPRVYSHEECCAHLGAEIDRFIAAVQHVHPSTRVPTCPRWTFADLVHHTGAIHRWASGIVTAGARRWPKIAATDDWPGPETPAGGAAWLAAGRDALLTALRSADPNAPVWAWGADQHVRFWSRRMLHETGIHRADAEMTCGATPTFANTTAVDGVSEFLENLWKARSWRWNIGKLHGVGETIRLRASDTGDEWTITLSEGAPTWAHRPSSSRRAADITIVSEAAGLYLLMWRRTNLASSEFIVTGEQSLFARWHKLSAV